MTTRSAASYHGNWAKARTSTSIKHLQVAKQRFALPCRQRQFSASVLFYYVNLGELSTCERHSMLRSRWAATFSRSWQPCRAHVSTSSTASTLSPVLLSRARALATEHAHLAEKLQEEYDIKTAKKAGSLTSIVSSLNDWETANDVIYHRKSFVRLITDRITVFAGASTVDQR